MGDDDDVKWIVFHGSGPFGDLEEKLQDLKDVYQKKYGRNFDDDEDEEEPFVLLSEPSAAVHFENSWCTIS